MKRLTVLLVALVALALAAAGCGAADPDAASVNGTAISRDALLRDAKAFAALDGDPFELRSTGSTYSANGIAGLLFTKITDVIVAKAAERYGLSVDQSDLDALREGGLGPYEALPAARLDALLRRAALQNKVLQYVTTERWWTDDDVAEYYGLVKDSRYEQACTRHILVEDEGLAEQVLADLRAGRSFDALAAQHSTDTSNKDQGGDLGCNNRGVFVAEFEQALDGANDGDLLGPVETQFGYHLILVTSAYRTRSLDEVRDEIVASFGDERAQGWADYMLRDADISVDPRYGTWNPETLGITPPPGAVTSTPNVVNPPR
jgi:foldase protein PrsA